MYDLLIKGWWKTSKAHNLIVWPNIPPLCFVLPGWMWRNDFGKTAREAEATDFAASRPFQRLEWYQLVGLFRWFAVGVLCQKIDQTWIQNDWWWQLIYILLTFSSRSLGKSSNQRENKYWPDWIDGRWLELFLLETGKVSCTVLPVHCQARTKPTDA